MFANIFNFVFNLANGKIIHILLIVFRFNGLTSKFISFCICRCVVVSLIYISIQAIQLRPILGVIPNEILFKHLFILESVNIFILTVTMF